MILEGLGFVLTIFIAWLLYAFCRDALEQHDQYKAESGKKSIGQTILGGIAAYESYKIWNKTRDANNEQSSGNGRSVYDDLHMGQ